MAAINRYNIMRDDNIRKVDKIFYLIQEVNRILNLEYIDLDNSIIKKFKNHLYIFVEDMLFNIDDDNSFTLTSNELKSLSDLYGELRNLESFIKDNLGNILTDKLVILTQVNRANEEHVHNLMQYQRRINAILNWIKIPIEKIYDVLYDDDTTYYHDYEYEYNDHEHLIVYDPAEDVPEPDPQTFPPDHTLTDEMIESSILGAHNQ